MPIDCSTMASRPAVTCSPVATTASYSRASCSGDGLAHPRDELVGDARHGRDHDGHLVAGIDLALDVARDVADALDVGDRRAAEFHDDESHVDPLDALGARALRRRAAAGCISPEAAVLLATRLGRATRFAALRGTALTETCRRRANAA